MRHAGATQEVTLEELERVLAVVAYCVLRMGPHLDPLLDRLEREVERARKDDPTERARRILEAQTERGGRKAIPLRAVALTSSE